MISELATSLVLLAASAEDYRTGMVHNEIWLLSAPVVVALSAWEYGSLASPIVFGVWFLLTGILAYIWTGLGPADVYALGLIGAGSTAFPWKALASIAVISPIYAWIYSRKHDGDIHLVPGIAFGYLAAFLAVAV